MDQAKVLEQFDVKTQPKQLGRPRRSTSRRNVRRNCHRDEVRVSSQFRNISNQTLEDHMQSKHGKTQFPVLAQALQIADEATRVVANATKLIQEAQTILISSVVAGIA